MGLLRLMGTVVVKNTQSDSFVSPRSNTAVLPWLLSLVTAFSPTTCGHENRLLPGICTPQLTFRLNSNGMLFPLTRSGRFSASFLHWKCGMSVEVESCRITQKEDSQENTRLSSYSGTTFISSLICMIPLASARRCLPLKRRSVS